MCVVTHCICVVDMVRHFDIFPFFLLPSFRPLTGSGGGGDGGGFGIGVPAASCSIYRKFRCASPRFPCRRCRRFGRRRRHQRPRGKMKRNVNVRNAPFPSFHRTKRRTNILLPRIFHRQRIPFDSPHILLYFFGFEGS